MKDKEKQIEEMAKCEDCILNEVCNFKYKEEYKRNTLTPVLSNIKKLKSEICKYYQPKLLKDSVVLTREEYNIIDHNIKHLESVCNNIQNYAEELETSLKQARKETAREILAEVGKVCGDYQWFKNLCKQYEVVMDNDK